MLYETGARIYNKRMLIAQDYVKFCGGQALAYCMTEISCKQLCWFPACVGKNNLDFVLSLELATFAVYATVLCMLKLFKCVKNHEQIAVDARTWQIMIVLITGKT